MKFVFTCAVTTALVGCTATSGPQPHPVQPTVLYRYPMQQNAILLAQTMAAHDLKDPEAAKFRDVFYISPDGRGEARDKSKDSWCIEVNGKNSYGAYTGYSWSFLPANGTRLITGSSSLGSMVTDICARAVYGPATVFPQTQPLL